MSNQYQSKPALTDALAGKLKKAILVEDLRLLMIQKIIPTTILLLT